MLPLEPPVDAVYGRLRAALERRGRLIGFNDLWIAAHAVALDHTLVTANDGRIAELQCENWLVSRH